jgi:hypothetical protein
VTIDPEPQATVARATPARIFVPIRHDQLAIPLELAITDPSPTAALWAPLGSVTDNTQ